MPNPSSRASLPQRYASRDAAERLRGLAGQHAFVVPAYGESPFLDACLTSLAAQTVASRVVIATSTPCRYIAQAADAHGVEVIVNPRREGIAGDWNFALGCVKSRLVTLAHQDDVYFPAFLERTLAAFATRPGSALCFTGYDEIGDQGQAKRSKISVVKHALERLALGSSPVAAGLRLRAFLAFGNPLPCSSVTFDRDQLPELSFSPDYDSNLDWDLWVELLGRGKVFARAPERLIGRRHNEFTETSKLLRDGRRLREDLSMFRRLWPAPLGDAIALVYRLGY